jgi:hypothetical protein
MRGCYLEGCSTFAPDNVTGRQQQRRRLRRPGPENGLKFQRIRRRRGIEEDHLCPQRYALSKVLISIND